MKTGKWYYIKLLERPCYFINLAGHFSTTTDEGICSRWDDPDHKAMWYYVHELKACTNREWIVVDGAGKRIEESEDARTFCSYKVNTLDNVVKDLVVEPLSYNETFEDDKPLPDDVYYCNLLINGKVKYLPIAKVGNLYYRYKHCLPAPDMTTAMWHY